MKLKFEVQNTAHDFVYDSLYMNFAFANSNNAGWLATNNAVSTGYRSAFFTITGGTADVLVYGTLEGPEHGMYARVIFEIDDDRRVVAVDLPNYWPVMVYDDYTINLTAYGCLLYTSDAADE